MEEIYLNSDLKSYYHSDFVQNVLNEKDKSWGLNENIIKALTKINDNNSLQTLYSKFPHGGFGSIPESYLTFAYKKEVELEIYRFCFPQLIFNFSQNDSERCYYHFFEPKDNILYSDEKSEIKLGCFSNPNYFRINHLRIVYEFQNRDRHLEF